MYGYHTGVYLVMLERLTTPYFLQKRLEERYRSPDDRVRTRFYDKIEEYKQRIRYFSKTVLKDHYPPEELAKPHTPDSELSAIAKESALYFQQGLEMFRTSLNMPETSSPLVEYYGFLQCVKGMVLLELDVNKKHFFSLHGLTFGKKNSPYINAKIMPRGVFSALILRIGGWKIPNVKDAIDFFFSSSYNPSLEEIFIEYSPHGGPVGGPINSFIGSWMLSTLVRYNPLKWREILYGKDDDIIAHIRHYRRTELSEALEHLFKEYVPHPDSWHSSS